MTNDDKLKAYDAEWQFTNDLYNLCKRHIDKMMHNHIKGGKTIAHSHILAGLGRIQSEMSYSYFLSCQNDDMQDKQIDDIRDGFFNDFFNDKGHSNR